MNIAKKLAIHMGGNDVDAMLARQNLAADSAHARRVFAGAIGALGGQPLPRHGNLLFFTGAPINGAKPHRFTDADAAARLFAGFDGAFAGVFWDAQSRVLVIATDCLGMQPLYMRESGGELIVVSETKAVAGGPDPAAWGAFIAIGHPIGARSLMGGLARVPPASVLVYDCARATLTIGRYWTWPEPSAAWRGYDFVGALEAEIRAYAQYGLAATLLLSGGFDSRLLLFLLKRARVPVDALIVAHDDEHADADGRLAERVARLAGVGARKVRPADDFFDCAAYLDYLAASDVGFPSLGLFIAKVASQIDSPAVWDGLAPGFVFMPLHQSAGGLAAYRQDEVRGWDSPAWRAARVLFKPDIARAMFEGFRADFDAELADLPQDGHGVTRFVIENRSRNRAASNPLKVYANRAVAFAPGLSKDFIAHAATIPFAEKQNGRFYRALFAQLDRRALKIPFLSGGELLAGARFSPAYAQARLAVAANRYRTRHPRLFALSRRGRPRPAPPGRGFLTDALFDDDPWLAEDARQKMRHASADSDLAWRLLFHWRAWHWLHAGKLGDMLDSGSRPDRTR